MKNWMVASILIGTAQPVVPCTLQYCRCSYATAIINHLDICTIYAQFRYALNGASFHNIYTPRCAIMDQHIIIQIYTQARKAMDIQMTIISVMLHIPQDEIPVQQASPHPHPSQKAFVNHSSSM